GEVVAADAEVEQVASDRPAYEVAEALEPGGGGRSLGGDACCYRRADPIGARARLLERVRQRQLAVDQTMRGRDVLTGDAVFRPRPLQIGARQTIDFGATGGCGAEQLEHRIDIAQHAGRTLRSASHLDNVPRQRGGSTGRPGSSGGAAPSGCSSVA